MPYERLKLASRKTVGAKQTLKACQQGNVECVYVAMDAESHVTRSIMELCQEKSIPVLSVESMHELGKACNIQVSCAIAAIIKA